MQLRLAITMQKVYTKNQNSYKTIIIIGAVKFIMSAFKRYTYRIDSITFKNDSYLVTFFYIARRQPLIKSAEEIFKNKPLLKMFKPNEVALISYLYARARYEDMIKKENIIVN